MKQKLIISILCILAIPHRMAAQDSLLTEPLTFESHGNPIIRRVHTADPAALVVGDTLWLYCGHDYKGGQTGYRMYDWLVFSTTDMVHWTEYPIPLSVGDLVWNKGRGAWAGQVIERGGRYYWYVCSGADGIGVAVADRPQGPFRDAVGHPIVTNADCFDSTHSWVCIDPTVFIDDDGQAWLFWGNKECYYAPLAENMTELSGPVRRVQFPDEHPFTEAPWVYKHDGHYYLVYASEWPEKCAYAMAESIHGPWQFKGIISELSGNCNTTHPAIVQFHGQWLFFTHNGGLPDGTSHSRSVVAEPMQYAPDGSILKIHPSTEGVGKISNL